MDDSILQQDVRTAWKSSVRALNYCENNGLDDTRENMAEIVCKLSQALEFVEATQQ